VLTKVREFPASNLIRFLSTVYVGHHNAGMSVVPLASL
jgi:hypothetical protein